MDAIIEGNEAFDRTTVDSGTEISSTSFQPSEGQLNNYLSSYPVNQNDDNSNNILNENTIVPRAELYPEVDPYYEGILKVSSLHDVAYYEHGNYLGKPVIYVHGGPGAGTSPQYARYFDPNAYRIILCDQRGCGKSRPFGEISENTTWDLVEDFEKLRKYLNIEKWQVFGGSWGVTLSLAYATKYPERVSELILRGILLCRKSEIDWLCQGPGASLFFPEDWALYESIIPENERYDFVKAYGKRARGEMGSDEMIKACQTYSIWEGRLGKLVQDSFETVSKTFGVEGFATALTRIECHYFENNCFFPRDGYLLEKEQLDRIKHIPTVMVHGRYDIIVPPASAYELKKMLPDAELIITMSGHSGFEMAIIKELVQATDKFKVI